MTKKTLILGATTNTDRVAFKAAEKLLAYGHEIALAGIREGMIFGHIIDTQKNFVQGVDTVTLYINPTNQRAWYDYILSLRPRRIVFNPGTENDELMQLAEQNGIFCEEACTLVLLGTGQY
jgi:predicted CoA-binding protein